MARANKKRFIAGAVCPRCQQMDTIVMYRSDDTDFRECVACDFKDRLHLTSPARELTTRVNVTEQDKVSETQPLRFIEGTDEADG